MTIPKYILKKIEMHNNLLLRAVKLEREIDDWYESVMNTNDFVYSSVPEYELSDYKCGLQITYISTENMQRNLDTLIAYTAI